MFNPYKALVQQRADLVKEQQSIFNLAEKEGRGLTEAEKERDDAIVAELQTVASDLARHERQQEWQRTVQPAKQAKAPAYNKEPLGETWAQGFAHWAKTGNKSGLDESDFNQVDVEGSPMEGVVIRAASNATDMNIGTAADGGDITPTGFYNQIVARRDESDLASKLPLLNIPSSGGGNVFDIPVDNEADGEFVATSEAQTFDLDAPALAKKTATLALYSKYTDVSFQLLRSTPTDLLNFLSGWVGRGWAKTRNNLLLTEVASNGTSLKTFASATAIAAGEPEAIVADDDLSNYMDEENAVAFVMRSATHWAIKSLTGNPRLYGSDQGMDGKSLLGYPVYYSQKAAARGASAKSVYFGNWRYVAKVDGTSLTFIRDPYTVAVKGQVRMIWFFEQVFKVAQAEAIGYGVHPSA